MACLSANYSECGEFDACGWCVTNQTCVYYEACDPLPCDIEDASCPSCHWAQYFAWIPLQLLLLVFLWFAHPSHWVDPETYVESNQAFSDHRCGIQIRWIRRNRFMLVVGILATMCLTLLVVSAVLTVDCDLMLIAGLNWQLIIHWPGLILFTSLAYKLWDMEVFGNGLFICATGAILLLVEMCMSFLEDDMWVAFAQFVGTFSVVYLFWINKERERFSPAWLTSVYLWFLFITPYIFSPVEAAVFCLLWIPLMFLLADLYEHYWLTYAGYTRDLGTCALVIFLIVLLILELQRPNFALLTAEVAILLHVLTFHLCSTLYKWTFQLQAKSTEKTYYDDI